MASNQFPLISRGARGLQNDKKNRKSISLGVVEIALPKEGKH